jgi:hypothetical protein
VVPGGQGGGAAQIAPVHSYEGASSFAACAHDPTLPQEGAPPTPVSASLTPSLDVERPRPFHPQRHDHAALPFTDDHGWGAADSILVTPPLAWTQVSVEGRGRTQDPNPP